MSSSALPSSVQQVVTALRAGDREGARAALDRARAPGDAQRPSWLVIGQLEQALGADAAADAALLQHLDSAPRDLLALLLLGTLRAKHGDDRAANNFYRMALTTAARDGKAVSPAVAPLLDQARAFVEALAHRFAAHLERGMRDAQVSGAEERRIGTALDLLLGRRELHLQQPSMFYFPELPQRAFFEREEFAWLPALEAATDDIVAELEALLAGDDGFAPYMRNNPGQPPTIDPLLDDPSWSANYLWEAGVRNAATAQRCPRTMAALAALPMPVIVERSPMALFSALRPGTHIRPHNGLLNTRLICHLPLLAPSGCGLRVGAETREWKRGETLIFDDSIEHEAWNRGDRLRVVLLFEVWRPELTARERTALTSIFETIDTYQGAAVEG